MINLEHVTAMPQDHGLIYTEGDNKEEVPGNEGLLSRMLNELGHSEVSECEGGMGPLLKPSADTGAVSHSSAFTYLLSLRNKIGKIPGK